MVIVPIFTSLTPAEISAPETSTILPTELLDKELFIDMAPMVALPSVKAILFVHENAVLTSPLYRLTNRSLYSP